MTNPKTIMVLGILTTFGAFIGMLADVFSAWSPNANNMDTAFSVSLESIRGLYENKPRWSYVLGNYLGVYFIPFHMLGFFLVYQALKPASKIWSMIFLAGGLYLTCIGTGLHGTLAFVGDIIGSRDASLIDGMRDYWEPWAYSLVALYAILSILIMALILAGRSLYPRWVAIVSPLVLVVITGLVTVSLPDNATGLKSFLSVTGLNLPLMVFFAVTTGVLARRKDLSLAL